MKLFFDSFLIVFAGFWLLMAARGLKREFDEGQKFKWVFAFPIFVGFLGFSSFFAQAFSAEGIIKLPKSYEWPVGYATNVITMSTGHYVVPIVPSGRVQLYDANWHFLCGWNVDALGGDFRVATDSPGFIDVYTARGQHHYTYNENGDLISSAPLAESYYSLPNSGQSVTVRTPLVLWPFSNPFVSVVVGTLGFVGLALIKKVAKNRARPDPRI